MRFSLLWLPWCTPAANELLDTTAAAAAAESNVIADANNTDQPTDQLASHVALPNAADLESSQAAGGNISGKDNIGKADDEIITEGGAGEVVSASPSSVKKEAVYSYEGDDYPGADEGVLVALPPRAIGPVEPLEYVILTEVSEETGDGSLTASANHAQQVWPSAPELIPYYEWMIAQARGNRFALPDPIVQQLEQLDRAIQSFESTAMREVPVERRRLQLTSLLSLIGTAANNNSGYSFLSSDSGLAFDAQQFPGLINTISGSVSNVVQAAGEAVGVTTTTAKPVSQAVLGLLSILQGFQKLAEAAGSMGLQFKPVATE